MNCAESTILLEPMIRYDMRCCFNVCSNADINQLNLPHGTKNLKWKKEKPKSKNGYAQNIGKQSGESVESVMEKKRKAMVGRICRKGRF